MYMVPRIQWWNKIIEKLQELIHVQIIINKRMCKDKSIKFNFDYKRKSTTTKQLETTFHFKRWPWKSVTSITYLTNSTKNIWTQSKCFKGEQIINTPIYVKFVRWRQWKYVLLIPKVDTQEEHFFLNLFLFVQDLLGEHHLCEHHAIEQ